MYALPGQTLAEAQADIDMALSFAPPHLSLYHLTMEPNTVFAKYPPQLPGDDESADIQDMIAERWSPPATSTTRSRRMPGRATARATT
jgi:coproporphyrinogen III oxidase-like Fe-S oxidoreductase